MKSFSLILVVLFCIICSNSYSQLASREQEGILGLVKSCEERIYGIQNIDSLENKTPISRPQIPWTTTFYNLKGEVDSVFFVEYEGTGSGSSHKFIYKRYLEELLIECYELPLVDSIYLKSHLDSYPYKPHVFQTSLAEQERQILSQHYPKSAFSYYLDSAYNVVSRYERRLGAKPENVKKSVYKYDTTGKITDEFVYNLWGGRDTVVFQHIIYHYEQNGQVNLLETFLGNGLLFSSTIFEYDEFANLTLSKYCNAKSPDKCYDIKYEYKEFDRCGNWTKRLVFHKYGEVRMHERTIKYFTECEN